MAMHAGGRRSAVLILRAFALAGVAAGCASHLPDVPPDVSIGPPHALPTPRIEPMGSAPEILGMHFSTLDVRRGELFSGEFVTGTNVASIEVRTNLFSIDVPRTGYGRFAFTLDVLDTPPIFIRPFRLRVIARNSAGAEYERDLPFEIR
ncbi:MAG: hypothetical protein WB615_03620 [Candidatus Tumulicola sp.]